MSADQLALVVDPVAWLLAILGALGFVGMAIVAAIGAARHLADGRAWAAERRHLLRVTKAQRDTERRSGYLAGWRDAVWTMSPPTAVADDQEALARHHAAAAVEGLTEAPPYLPNGQHDPKDS